MSGSGGSGFGSSNSAISCDRLNINAQIVSPKPLIISRLSIADTLDVEIIEHSIVLTFEGEEAGGVFCNSYDRLYECIQAGSTYTASVLSITNGQVKVKITPGIRYHR